MAFRNIRKHNHLMFEYYLIKALKHFGNIIEMFGSKFFKKLLDGYLMIFNVL